ncbi:hypothetical protein CYMTET_55424 [Cymbomonas tetramitiformis]|uniref:RNA-directed DNA polymerase n=1 Tax=Cymbomonas tetramitiformis TaxID=36881 RepID=A0AAE0EMU5_9CHLO|nr:hypothetical protein CYMTET_55424 [Cymbomonas tetramitiformis]
MYTTDLRALKNEGYLLRDIEKMVGKLPTFPSSEMKKGNEMEELEVLRTAVVKLTEHAYVKTALRTATCREEVLGRMILDMPTLLWMVMDKSLAKPQKLYLEELAPGGSEGEEWQRRFVSVNQFMGDLAFSCGISLDALKRLKTELLAAVQGTSETASAYYTRMSVGWETVNFVADVVEQCTKMSRLELLGTFWAGLTHSTLVGTRLQSLDLDTSYPETWEQKQKQLQRRDTSAILKVRDVATMIEEEKIKEEAALAALISRKMTQHISTQSSPRIRPTGARPFASGQAPVWKPRPFTPRRPEIAAIKWKEEDDKDSQVALANTQPASKQVRFSPRPANTPSSYTPRERPCFACGKLDHMIADCKDEAAVAKWRADAPARLARRQAPKHGIRRLTRGTITKPVRAKLVKLAEESRRVHEGRIHQTKHRQQRRYDLDQAKVEGYANHLETEAAEAWAELSPKEQLRAVRRESGPNARVSRGSWRAVGMQRVRARQQRAASVIQAAYRRWKQPPIPPTPVAVPPRSIWARALATVRQAGKAVYAATVGRRTAAVSPVEIEGVTPPCKMAALTAVQPLEATEPLGTPSVASSEPATGSDSASPSVDAVADRVLKCEHLSVKGHVQWELRSLGSQLTSTLAAASDEEGPLLLVFYAYLGKHLVKVLVDSGASDNFISEKSARKFQLTTRASSPMRVTLADGSVKTAGAVAYTKFKAHTRAGKDYVENKMELRVLPLGIQVDVVLGGKWLRSLSPVTLDYAGNGAISFCTSRKGGGSQSVTLEGCTPGVRTSGKKGQSAALIDEVFLTAVQLKQHLVHAETRRQAGEEDCDPAWLMMAVRGSIPEPESAFACVAFGDAAEGESAVVCGATGDVAEGKVISENQDSRDAKVSQAWKQRFDAFFTDFPQQLTTALPGIAELRHDKCDEAQVNLKPDASGPPCKRPYKQSSEAARQLRDRLEVPMAEKDIEKTAFTTQMGAYEWLVMPQGLQNSPAQYQRRYYRRFVHHFSEIAKPLTALTKTDEPWQWGEQQQWAFDELKEALSSAPVLALPDIKKAADGSAPFLVQADASGVALGGVLMQDTGDGMQVIAYDSRQFSAAEQNYHTGERELCALHHCTTVTWRHYLCFSEFRLQGDHRPLEWLMSPGRELSRRQARWYMDLVEVGVPRMEYVKGALLLVPDALSRRPDYVTLSPRAGLVEAGVVDGNTDRPAGLVLNAAEAVGDFGDEPPVPVPAWLATVETWVDGVLTLQMAERAQDRASQHRSKGTEGAIAPIQQQQKSSQQQQGLRVRREVFERLQRQFGEFDVDANCERGGGNRLAEQYWTDCLNEKWRGKHVWCSLSSSGDHPSVEAVLRKYVDEWRTDPSPTSAVFLLPDVQARLPQWRRLFRMTGMRLVEVIPTTDDSGVANQLYENTGGVLQNLSGPMLVVYAPPSRQQVPRNRYPRVLPPVIRQGEAARVRDAAEPPTDSKFLEALHDEYAREGPLRQLREQVLAAPHRTTKDFRVIGEVLWRVAAGRYQLVLGEDSPLREVIFWEAHDSAAAGHTGREKTLERVLRRFWWENAAEDVAGWVTSCPTCQAVRPRAAFPDGLLNPHSIPLRNWQEVRVDFVTGLPLTQQGNDAFIAFTCKLSKMVHVVPMNFGDSSAQTVARIYFDVIWRQHGAPMKIVLELAQQRQREQFDKRHTDREYAVGDLVWVDARHLTEKLMDRQLCRKLAKRWHGPLAVTERFHSDLQAALPEADRGAPVAYRLALPAHWRVHDVFAQHRLKPFVHGAKAFASRQQWRTRDKMDRGAENQQLKEFETRRLRQQAEDVTEEGAPALAHTMDVSAPAKGVFTLLAITVARSMLLTPRRKGPKSPWSQLSVHRIGVRERSVVDMLAQSSSSEVYELSVASDSESELEGDGLRVRGERSRDWLRVATVVSGG